MFRPLLFFQRLESERIMEMTFPPFLLRSNDSRTNRIFHCIQALIRIDIMLYIQTDRPARSRKFPDKDSAHNTSLQTKRVSYCAVTLASTWLAASASFTVVTSISSPFSFANPAFFQTIPRIFFSPIRIDILNFLFFVIFISVWTEADSRHD